MDGISNTPEGGPEVDPEGAAFGPGHGTSSFWLRTFVHRRRYLFFAGLLALLLLPGLLRLESDNSPEVFFLRESPSLFSLNEHRRLFPGGESLRLVLRGELALEREGLRFLDELGRELEQLPGVRSVASLAFHHDRGNWPPRDLAAFRERVLTNRLDLAAGFVGGEGNTTTLLLELDRGDRKARLAMLARLETLLASAPDGLETEIVGLAELNRALDASSREIDRVFFPLLALFALAILLLTVRDLRDVLPPLLFVGLCLLFTLAPMDFFGAKLNLVLATLPPLIFAIALATSLHVLLHCRQLEDAVPGRVNDRRPFLARTLEEKTWPLLCSGITTVVGFASLITSPVAPIRSLGLWAAVGLTFLTLAAFFVLPALLLTFGGHRRHRTPPFEQEARRLGRWLADWSFRHRRGVLVVALVSSLVAMAGLPWLGTQSNAVHYLAPEHPQRRAIEKLEADGIGTAAVELRITLPPASGGPAPFATALAVDNLAELANVLGKREDVLGVLDAGTVLRDAAREVVSSPFAAGLQQQLVLEAMASDERGREVLSQLLDESRTSARVLVFVRQNGAEELFRGIDAFEHAARDLFPEATVVATGDYPLLLESQRYLISTLLISFSATLLTITVLFAILLKNVRLTLIALAPNLWPIVCVYGLMGWFGIQLDIATVMVSSIALGLVVDDTLHTLGHFRMLHARLGQREALVQVFESAAPVYCLNALVLVAGFGVCALSSFAPVALFGSICAATILVAVVGDIVLLSALLGTLPERDFEGLLARPGKTGGAVVS